MGKAEPERNAGTHRDWELEAAVGVDGPILAPFWITGACCGAQCMGEDPYDFSDAEAQGWLGTPLRTSGTCTVLCRAPFLAARGHPRCSWWDPANGSIPGFANFGERLQEQELGGKKMGFGVIFLLVSQSCFPTSFPILLLMLQIAQVPHCPSNAQGTQR